MSISFVSSTNTSRNLYTLSQLYAGVVSQMRKLSSGFNINQASDNPAGLVISEQLRSQIGTLNRELDTVDSSINKYSSVSSTVSSLRSNLSDLRELAIGASNSANEPAAQQAYTTTANGLIDTYNRTALNDEYNNKRTLDGSDTALAKAPLLGGIDLSTPKAAVASLPLIDEASKKLDRIQTDLGAKQKDELQSVRTSLEIQRENLTAAESQLRDANMAEVYSQFVGGLIQTRAALSMLSHSSISGSVVAKLFS